MKKNEYYNVKITDLTLDGNGVCRVEGMTVFVPHTAIGDHIRIKIVKVLKHYAFGIVDALEKASVDRIEPVCRQTGCGGCVFEHLNYEAELRIKEKSVVDAFTRIGKLSPEFLPILASPQRTRYRNKAQYPFAVDKNGIPYLGFYTKHSRRVVSVTDCLLQPLVFRKIAAVVLEFVRQKKIPVYDEATHTGRMRHLYLRQGAHSGEIMVCFVVCQPIREKLLPLVERLVEQFPQIHSVSMNVNPKQTNVILGSRTDFLWGSDHITDEMCGISVDLSPASFYQVNTAAAEQLYRVAKHFAELNGTERLLDFYCGAGTIGLSMADACKQLLGVEIVPDAVENAKRNAMRASISHAQFYCGDVGEIATQLQIQGETPDVIVVDPPRKGCNNRAINAMVQMQPKRIVMISCNPATAARDCALLEQKSYCIKEVQAVDLFPMTGNVECVIRIEKNPTV